MVNEPKTGVSASIVTVEPFAMITSSPATGTTPPAQVAVLLQLPPVPVEVLVCACEKAASSTNIKMTEMDLKKNEAELNISEKKPCFSGTKPGDTAFDDLEEPPDTEI